MNSATAPLLRIESLSKSFGNVEVLRGISFDLYKGETLALLGPSGSGKSTCLRCLNYLEKPNAGSIVLEDEVSLRYYENGVADELKMDFGDFTVDGRLGELQAIPSPC